MGVRTSFPNCPNNPVLFDTLLEAKVLIERGRREYNAIRPHSSLDYRPPGQPGPDHDDP